jgi:fatty acid desaturase
MTATLDRPAAVQPETAQQPESNLPPRPHPSGLTPEQLDAFGLEMDALREEILQQRGEADAAYIRRIIGLQRRLEVAGRVSLFAGILPPFWLAGTAMLAVAKILENMEIGHNVLHAQWDWMRDPDIHSDSWDWDNTCPAEAWKRTHNQQHHMWTNVVGRDRDVGYGVLRMSEQQRWSPATLGQPIYAAVLALLFEWGVALHDLEIEKIQDGTKTLAEARPQLAEVGRKAGRQALKDYVLFPALAGPFFLPVLTGNAVANVTRNLWSFAIIFCGHFPDGVAQFTEDDVVDESRGGWYARQVMGSGNISGGHLLDTMSGNLSYQIEHHAFPDLPSNRYAEVAPKVRELCERYGLPYTTGSFGKQFGSVVKRIVRFALPG